MGDRANVRFITNRETDPIYLYSHWGGSGIPSRVVGALNKASERWNDPSYCCRIMVSQIIGDEWKSGTGWGLSTAITDNDRDILEVDLTSKTIRLFKFDYKTRRVVTPHLRAWTFAEYVELDDLSWDALLNVGKG